MRTYSLDDCPRILDIKELPRAEDKLASGEETSAFAVGALAEAILTTQIAEAGGRTADLAPSLAPDVSAERGPPVY